MRPIQQSKPISRKQLAVLSDGAVDREKHGNPLKLRTPVSYTGGAAVATKGGRVSHITLKAKCNHPLPTDVGQEFVVYRLRERAWNGEVPGDVGCLRTQKNQQQHQKAIPIFWEPIKDNKVQYVGHWNVQSVEEKTFEYKKLNGCAVIKLTLDRYDEYFDNIISTCCKLTCRQIAQQKFDNEGRATKRSIDPIHRSGNKRARSIQQDGASALVDTDDDEDDNEDQKPAAVRTRSIENRANITPPSKEGTDMNEAKDNEGQKPAADRTRIIANNKTTTVVQTRTVPLVDLTESHSDSSDTEEPALSSSMQNGATNAEPLELPQPDNMDQIIFTIHFQNVAGEEDEVTRFVAVDERDTSKVTFQCIRKEIKKQLGITDLESWKFFFPSLSSVVLPGQETLSVRQFVAEAGCTGSVRRPYRVMMRKLKKH